MSEAVFERAMEASFLASNIYVFGWQARGYQRLLRAAARGRLNDDAIGIDGIDFGDLAPRG
jgi:hypothetical protein